MIGLLARAILSNYKETGGRQEKSKDYWKWAKQLTRPI